MDAADVTVVVPTKNEADNILPFLASIPATVSLIVVDASDDATPCLIAENRCNKTRIVRSCAHIAQAHNEGALLATTPGALYRR